MSDYNKLLPDLFDGNEAMKDLMDALNTIMYDNVEVFVELLAKQRQAKFMDRSFKVLSCAMLGFRFDSDLFDDNTLNRIIDTFAEYRSYSGTNNFVEYLSWVDNTSYELFPLWTEDYITFHELPGGGTVYDGTGPWYITPHIKMIYTSSEYKPLFDKIEDFILYMAPVNLVLDVLIKITTPKINTTLSIGGFESIILNNF